MDILVEFMYILIFSFLGEVLSVVGHLPVPGSVLGLILLFLALLTGILKVKQIARVTDFLLSNLSLFFVPAGVGIIAKYDQIKGHILALIVIIIVTTVCAQIVAGSLMQFLHTAKLKRLAKKDGISREVKTEKVQSGVEQVAATVNGPTEADKVADSVKEKVETVTNAVKDKVSEVTESKPVEEVKDKVEEVKENISNNETVKTVENKVSEASKPIVEKTEPLKEKANEAINSVKGKAEEAIGKIGSLFKKKTTTAIVSEKEKIEEEKKEEEKIVEEARSLEKEVSEMESGVMQNPKIKEGDDDDATTIQ